MKKERIKRLEELTEIKKKTELMGEVLEEYLELKEEYLESIRNNLKTQIENYGFVKKK